MSETCSSTFSSFEKSKGDSSSEKNKKGKCKRKHDTSTTTEQSVSLEQFVQLLIVHK